MQLKKLELKNYRNIKHAVYEFNGSSFIIGENRIGKTNTLEAISFVLSADKSDADIIPNSDKKAVVSVEATFDNITLKKELYNDFQYVRGTTTQENKGRITKYYVNGERVETAKEYQASFINSDIKDIVKMLTDPFYIGNLCQTSDWKKVRDFLFKNLASAKPNEKIKSDLLEVNGDTDALKKKYNAEIKTNFDLLKQNLLRKQMCEKCESMIANEFKKEFSEMYNDYKSEWERVGDLLTELEIKLDLLNTYILDQAKSIKDTKWQFFETTLKGDEKEKCEPYILGTNTLWHDGSKSEQVITGIAIIENIKKTLFLSDLPILFDEGGELSNTTIKTRLNTSAQIICVKVKDGISSPQVEVI